MIALFYPANPKWKQTTTYKKPLAVILHLYYRDLLDWYVPYLQNIKISHDLYITICKEEDPNSDVELVLKIQTKLPYAHLYLVHNKGMDVAPFLGILRTIDLCGTKYDTILKIHSKKSLAHGGDLGERWRKELVNALLFNSALFRVYQDSVTSSSKIKMVASQKWILKQKVLGYEQKYFKENIIFDTYNFVGGTMFLVDFNLIMDWFIEHEIDKLTAPYFEDGYFGDGTVAHELERVFGCLVHQKGFEILGV